MKKGATLINASNKYFSTCHFPVLLTQPRQCSHLSNLLLASAFHRVVKQSGCVRHCTCNCLLCRIHGATGRAEGGVIRLLGSTERSSSAPNVARMLSQLNNTRDYTCYPEVSSHSLSLCLSLPLVASGTMSVPARPISLYRH